MKLYENIYELKAKKGLIRVYTKVDPSINKIIDLRITGDFFIYPENKLWIIEKSMKNIYVDYDVIYKKFKEVIEREDIELVGSTIEDFVKAIYYSARGVYEHE